MKRPLDWQSHVDRQRDVVPKAVLNFRAVAVPRELG
jgi:hypothetical protein